VDVTSWHHAYPKVAGKLYEEICVKLSTPGAFEARLLAAFENFSLLHTVHRADSNYFKLMRIPMAFRKSIFIEGGF
jgi:hypothetical protein